MRNKIINYTAAGKSSDGQIMTEPGFSLKSFLNRIPSSIDSWWLVHACFQLIQIPGETGREELVGRAIINILKSIDYPKARIAKDSLGNIVVNIPARNCSCKEVLILSAHQDTVALNNQKVVPHIALSGVIKPVGNTILGADDRAGIAAILTCTKELKQNSEVPHPALRLVFTVEEEDFCHGARTLHEAFLQNVGFALCVDKNGFSDLLIESNLKLSKNTPIINLITQAGQRTGINPKIVRKTRGGSDAHVFHDRGIPSVNMSIGYQRNHSIRECLPLKDFILDSNWLYNSIIDLGLYGDKPWIINI